MTLAEKIRATRKAGERAEVMIDLQEREAQSREQVDAFMLHDVASDSAFKASIKRLYRTLTTDEQKELAALVYATWDQAEVGDDQLLAEHGDHIDGTRAYMYRVTPLMVERDDRGPDAA